MWRVLLSLIILFAVGRAVMFLLNWVGRKEKFSFTEMMIYSFSIGYASLTIIGTGLAQFSFLTFPFNLIVTTILPFLAVCLWIYKKRQQPSQYVLSLSRQDLLGQERNFSARVKVSLSSIRFSHIILLLVLVTGLVLRLETQLTVSWLGDQDPYYHLSFIDSIIAQGVLPSRTFWGFYSYPPSFHVVFATLISTVQADRFLFMKIVPEFLGFLCVPAAYALIKRKYGEWPGIVSAAFLAICSFHIYRTNIAIPEPIALLALLMFFHAVTNLTGTKKWLLAGLFASMVFLTNVVGILYFLPSVLAISFTTLVLRRWNEALTFLKATFIGIIFSGVFWLPTLYKLGLSGIFEGLGPSYPFGQSSYTSNTYFSWIGWGACILAFVGLFVCAKNFKDSLVILIPTIFFVFLVEAANNGYYFFETNLLFRGLLFLGTWTSLLAGVGASRLMQTKRKKMALVTLAFLVVLTALSFPIFSRNRYPVNWDYDNADFFYHSYLENYADIFKNQSYIIYSADYAINYGAFHNVLLDREAPQIGEALLKNDVSTLRGIIAEYNIGYLILQNGTQGAEFLVQSNLARTYYENWQTTVLVIK